MILVLHATMSNAESAVVRCSGVEEGMDGGAVRERRRRWRRGGAVIQRRLEGLGVRSLHSV